MLGTIVVEASYCYVIIQSKAKNLCTEMEEGLANCSFEHLPSETICIFTEESMYCECIWNWELRNSWVIYFGNIKDLIKFKHLPSPLEL